MEAANDRTRTSILSAWELTIPEKKNEIGIYTYARFIGHLMRILKFQDINKFLSYAKEDIQRKEAYFWRQIISEISDKQFYSMHDLARQVDAELSFIQAIYKQEIDSLEMPLLVGEKLLNLHKQLCPDLQRRQVD